MGKWKTGEYKKTLGPLTASFDDNSVETENARNGFFVVYVSYVKGTEANAEMTAFFDNSDRGKVDSDGNPLPAEWYQLTCDGWWAADSIGDGGGVAPHTYIVAKGIPWRFSATGKYRIVLMKWPREQHVKLAVRANTPGATPGHISLRWCTDDISWGGVGQGE